MPARRIGHAHGTLDWQGQQLPFFFANGAGGQYIFVVPQLDLVGVVTD